MRKRWIIAGVAIVAVVIGASLLRSRTPDNGPQAERDSAGRRWAQQAPQHYRLQFTFIPSTPTLVQPSCIVSVEVRGTAQVGRMPDDTCDATWTVPQVFRFVDEHFLPFALHPKCGPNGCRCDGAWRTTISYDAVLGYPQAASGMWDQSRSWLDRLLNPNLPCTAIGASKEEQGFHDVVVTPLP